MKRYMVMVMVMAAGLMATLAGWPAAMPAAAEEACCPEDEGTAASQKALAAEDLVKFVQDADVAKEVKPDKPALPEGHPSVPGSLPEGHPSVPGGLPGGHPPIPGAAPGGLPGGHPPIPGAGGTTVNEDELKPLVATLIIKTAQGTEGGPAVADAPVSIQFVHRGQPLGEQTTTLDEHGVVMLEGLEFPRAVQPVVTIEHQGVKYQAVGYPMTASQPDQIVRVEVYESTTQTPKWEVAMRHVMLQRTEDGLMVEEVMSVLNPTDKAWRAQASGDDPGATVVLPLPAGAEQLQLGPGFDRAQSRVVDGKVMTHAAILPGTTKLRYRYLLPASAGGVTLAIKAPAPVKHMMVFVPDDGQTVRSENIGEGQSMRMGSSQVRVYSAQEVEAGSVAKLIFPGLTAAAEPAGAASQAGAYGPTTGHEDESKQPRTTRLVAGVGGAALVVGAVIVLLRGPGQNRAKA